MRGRNRWFLDRRTWYEMTPQGHIPHIFSGLPAGVPGARYLYEKIEEAFETETAAFEDSGEAAHRFRN